MNSISIGSETIASSISGRANIVYYNDVFQFGQTCTCCGKLKFTMPCPWCKLEVCNNCNNISVCVLCMAKKGLPLTDTQQKQLELVYSQGGFQYNKAHNKFANLK